MAPKAWARFLMTIKLKKKIFNLGPKLHAFFFSHLTPLPNVVKFREQKKKKNFIYKSHNQQFPILYRPLVALAQYITIRFSYHSKILGDKLQDLQHQKCGKF